MQVSVLSIHARKLRKRDLPYTVALKYHGSIDLIGRYYKTKYGIDVAF